MKQLTVNNLIIGNKYKWKYENDILIYVGQSGRWSQFNLESTGKLWCEVLDTDLRMMEEVK